MTDPITTWNVTTINGKKYLVVDVASFRIPLDWDPSSNMFIAVAAPSGGYGNIPALLKGDQGDTPTLDNVIDLTVLDYSDPSPDSATLNLLGGIDYQVAITLHQGPPGAAGSVLLDPADFGIPLAGKMIVVNGAVNDFVYQSQLVGDRYIPSVINATPAGNPLYTLAPVSVPAQPFDWRPTVEGQAVIVGTGSRNVSVDLIARLNDAAAGNIVGRAFGPPGPNGWVSTLASGPPAGSIDAYDRVVAGAAAVVYLRAERQSGTDTFTTSATTTSFRVKVDPIPGTGVLG